MRINLSISRNRGPGIRWKWCRRCQQQFSIALKYLPARAHLNTAICTLWATSSGPSPLLPFTIDSCFFRLTPISYPPLTSLFLSLSFSSFISPAMNVSHWRHLSRGHTQMRAHTHYVNAPVLRVISSQRDLINVFWCRWVFSLIYLTNRTCSTLELSSILQRK